MVKSKRSLYSMQKFQHMTEEGKSVGYKVTKFSDDLEPIEQYTLNYIGSNRWVCNCPALRNNCRHVKMVPLFEAAWDGNDPTYREATQDGVYTALLSFDGETFKWERGALYPEV